MKTRVNINLNDFDIKNIKFLSKTFNSSASELIRWFIAKAIRSPGIMKQFCLDTGRDFESNSMDIIRSRENQEDFDQKNDWASLTLNNQSLKIDLPYFKEDIEESLWFLLNIDNLSKEERLCFLNVIVSYYEHKDMRGEIFYGL